MPPAFRFIFPVQSGNDPMGIRIPDSYQTGRRDRPLHYRAKVREEILSHMGLVGLEPTTYKLKARYSIQLSYRPIKVFNCQGSCVVCLDHFLRIPPFHLQWWSDRHFRKCHRQQKRGGNFQFLSPVLRFLWITCYICLSIFADRRDSLQSQEMGSRILN